MSYSGLADLGVYLSVGFMVLAGMFLLLPYSSIWPEGETVWKARFGLFEKSALIGAAVGCLIFSIGTLGAIKEVTFFSLELAVHIALNVFWMSAVSLLMFDIILGFETEQDQHWIVAYALSLFEWAAKGSLFDILESFDVQFPGTEATKNKVIFDTIEFTSRTGWGFWSAYFSACVVVKFRAWRRGSGDDAE